MKIQIKHDSATLFECDVPDTVGYSRRLQHALENATSAGADLYGADLRGADLRGADLSGASLRGADLRGASLRGADLSEARLASANLHGASLRGANLCWVNLSGAQLASANLHGASLRGADLSGADLSGADLRGADLSGADLSGADLSGADLRGADLSGASLRGAKGVDLVVAKTRILPQGALIGWKKCRNGVIVKLRIPEEAKRSHAFGRKCRAEFADVVEIEGADVAISSHDGKTEYRVGQRVTPDSFSDDWQDECAPGIHFFITRDEAVAY